jgi:hypothetical protein
MLARSSLLANDPCGEPILQQEEPLFEQNSGNEKPRKYEEKVDARPPEKKDRRNDAVEDAIDRIGKSKMPKQNGKNGHSSQTVQPGDAVEVLWLWECLGGRVDAQDLVDSRQGYPHRGRALVVQFQLQPGCFAQLNSVEICVQSAEPKQPAKTGCQLQPIKLHCTCVVRVGQ